MSSRPDNRAEANEGVRQEGAVYFAPFPSQAAPESSQQPEEGGTIDWGRYLDALRKRVWLIVAIVIVSGVFTTIYTLRQPKLYRSSTSVVIETSTPKVLTGVQEVVDVGSGGWVAPAFYETEYQVMRSRAVARRAAEKLGLMGDDDKNGLAAIEDPVVREQRRAILDPADIVLGKYTIISDSKSNVVRFEVVSPDPPGAAALANAAAESYIELNLEKRVDGTRDASTWLAVQNIDLKKKLEASEDLLYVFMTNNDVLNASIESQLDEVKQRLQSFNTRLADMQAERIRDQLDARALQDVRSNPVLLDSLAEIQDAEVINTLKAKLVELRATQTDLAARYQEAHPRMKALDEQIKALQSTLTKEVEAVLLGLDRRQASLATTEAGLKKAIADEREREARLNKLSLDYQRLKREVSTNGKLYDMVTSRMKEADITSALPFNNVRILDRAMVATEPFKPNLRTSILSGVLLGLFAAIGLVLVLAILDTTIKTQEDIEHLLSVPFLGLLPLIETRKDPASTSIGRAALEQQTLDRDNYVMQHPASTPAECARFIRTNLMFMSPDKPMKTLVVTSAGPQEGKTTTAVSLSVVMAQAGSRTLIVDTDMRRPRLHRVFGMANDVGISSVIVGEATLEQAIRKSTTENLDVLVCGPMPPNPAELLHTDRFREIVAELGKRYDRVIFDTPPAGPVTDPVVLGTQVDGTILVVKCEKTNKALAQMTIRMLRDAKARVLGAVLNDVDIHAKRYGRAYHSYYSRYSAYYRNDKGEKKAPAT